MSCSGVQHADVAVSSRPRARMLKRGAIAQGSLGTYLLLLIGPPHSTSAFFDLGGDIDLRRPDQKKEELFAPTILERLSPSTSLRSGSESQIRIHSTVLRSQETRPGSDHGLVCLDSGLILNHR